jgi:hypothetical protein
MIEADGKNIYPRYQEKRERQNTVPASCAYSITPGCLQALYGIPTEPSSPTVNKLGVPGYTNYYANHEDLEVGLIQFLSLALTNWASFFRRF